MSERKLTIIIGGDARGGKKALDDTGAAATGMGSKFGGVAKGMAVGFGVVGAAALGFAAKSASTFARVGGEVAKLSRFTGATAEDASRLRFAGAQAGLGVDDMTKSLGILSKNLAGTKLDKLGLELKDVHGKALPLNDSLLKIADRIASMPNGAEKTALAMQLFGKSGAAMLPFLNKGAAGIAELERQSDKFGSTLSGKDLEATKAATANKRLFASAMEGLQIQVGRYVLPILTKFTTFMATNMPAAIGLVRGVMEGLSPVFSLVGRVIGIVATQLGMFINALRTGFTEDEGTPIERIALKIRAAFGAVLDFVSPVTDAIRLIVGDWQGLMGAFTERDTFGLSGSDGLEGKLYVAAKAMGDFVSWVEANWPKVQAVISDVMTVVSTVITTYVAVIQAVWNTFGDNIMNAIQRVWPPIRQIIQGVMEEIRGVIDVISGLIHGNWGQVWDGIKLIFSGAWNEMLGIVKLIFEQIRLAISVAMEAVGIVFKAGWDALVSFATSLPGRIVGALAALGGLLVNAGSAAVTGYVNSLKTGFSAAVTFVSSIPGKVVSALGDVSHLLYNAGVAIMKSLLTGVTDGFKAVGHFVGGVAGKIASLKGPLDYDARLLIPHGNAIMQSLIDGLQGRYGPLLDMVSRIAGAVSAQFGVQMPGVSISGSVSGSGPGGGFDIGGSFSGPGGGGQVHLHVHLDDAVIANDQAMDTFAEKIRQKLEPVFVRNGIPFAI